MYKLALSSTFFCYLSQILILIKPELVTDFFLNSNSEVDSLLTIV